MFQPTHCGSEEVLTPFVTSHRTVIPELHVLLSETGKGQKREKEMKRVLPESNFCILFTLAVVAQRRDLLGEERWKNGGVTARGGKSQTGG